MEIKWLNDLSADMHAKVMAGAYAMVYPVFVEDYNPVVMEAMQCGVPVIASNTTSLPEVVGDAGVLLNQQDEAAIAEAIGRLCRDEVWRQELAARGGERATKFTWNRCVDQVVATYQAALRA